MIDLRAALDLCGLQPGERFALAAILDKRITPAVFSAVPDAEAWLSTAAGNLYITGNPIKPGVTGRPTADDAAALRVLLMDLDPTGADLVPAGDAAMDLWERVGERGALIDSGRGHQVWLRVEGDVDRRRLGRWLAAQFARDGVKIDGTHDPCRLMRLPGTTNTKTGRLAQVVAEGKRETITRAEVEAWTAGWSEPKERALVAASREAPTALEQRRWVRGAVRELWDNPTAHDRSKRDFLLVLELIRAGCPQVVASRLLFAMPEGKANVDGRGDDYWDSTIQSVYARIDEDEARASLIAGLAAQPDSRCFEPESVRALAWQRANDPVAWQDTRAALKRGRAFRVSDLEEAMDAASSVTIDPPDEHVIYGRTVEGERAGWWLPHNNGAWTLSPAVEVATSLAARGFGKTHMEAARRDPWTVVSEPFKPQRLDQRRWNLSRAQWRIAPSPGPWPAWQQLLRVVGRGLDEGVSEDAWCQEHGIGTGADYLLTWIASMAQQPHRQTAYLFAYSNKENIGKSMLHASLARHLLAEGSVMDADQALTSEGAFNGELVGVVLCVVEETDLGTHRGAAINRLKAWVGNEWLKIHAKGRSVCRVPNNTHWYQTANKPGFCPLFERDSRITAWEAQPPLEEELCEKEDMHQRLSAEAPAFLAEILGLTLPARGDGRLAVPAVVTAEKRRQQQASRSELEVWLAARPTWWALTDEEILASFLAGLTTSADARYWTRGRVLRELPDEPLRDLVGRLRQLGEWSGSPEDLAEAIGWRRGVKALGIALSQAAAGASWITRQRTGRGRVFTLTRPEPAPNLPRMTR